MTDIVEELLEKRAPINAKSLAFFVCDMQNDFVHLEGAFAKHQKKKPYGHSIIPAIKKTLKTIRDANIPVFYTMVVNRKDGVGQSHRQSRLIGALTEDTWGAEIVDDLKPRKNEFIIVKWRYSAFYATPLEAMLRGLGVKTIVLTGVATNGGVDSTARDAEYRDFGVVVLSDCCASRKPELHEATLETIRSAFGRVMTSNELTRILKS